MRLAHPLIMASVAAALGLAACSSTPSATVPHLAAAATSTTAATGTTAAPSGGAGKGGPGSGADQLAKMEAFAGCMRSHGVPGFPDPTPGTNGQGGGFQIRSSPGSGLDPNSAAFKEAQQACHTLLPNGGVAQPLTAAQEQAFLAWAACMRTHGVPDFPDPQFGSGGTVRIGVGAGKGFDPSSSQFAAAQQACKSKMPGGFGAAG
jgi:hypothetical protein